MNAAPKNERSCVTLSVSGVGAVVGVDERHLDEHHAVAAHVPVVEAEVDEPLRLTDARDSESVEEEPHARFCCFLGQSVISGEGYA